MYEFLHFALALFVLILRMSLASLHDTICALSTPPGRSAIASIRMTGEDAISIAARIIDSPEKLYSALGGSSVYTNILDRIGNVIDDCLVTIYRAPNSFTGEDVVEIFPHGSTVITDIVLERLVSLGARIAEPGEFSRRALINGKMRIEQLEEVNLRVDAASPRQLERARQMVQIKYTRLRTVYDKIIELLSLVNAQIDFGESDHIEIDGFEQRVTDTQSELSDILAASKNRALNKGYISVSFVGEPNVGKSSLFNALLKYERSIVSETPGTTRDYIEAYITLDGFRIKLIDTAGIRESHDSIESRGIALGKDAADETDILLRVTDPTSRNTIARGSEVLIHNKSDIDGYSGANAVTATTKAGIEKLILILEEELRTIDASSSSVLLSQTEVSSIGNVLSLLENVLDYSDVTLLAEDLRQSAEIIASLSGLNISEDSLNHIFLKMCIGK